MPSVKRKPSDYIPNLSSLTIGDFWSWAYSDVLSNVSRGVYAEFLVGTALGVLNGVRGDWDDFDLVYHGVKVEVKSAAYVQTWAQEKDSAISFSIAPKQATNKRLANVYVFCLFNGRDADAADVLDPMQWEFYIVPEHCLPAQKSIGLKPLCQLCERQGLAQPVGFDKLKTELDALL